MPDPVIRRALISVSDKTGLVPFAKRLSSLHIEILSTGGTLSALKKEGIPAIAVESVTGFPEIMDGRVKTLHPKIHGGLLYRRDEKSHCQAVEKHSLCPIDLLVVNLYPFEEVIEKPSVKLETAIENIDIGGPAMLRSAAKNSDFVTVICDPADYEPVIEEIKKNKGSVPESLRRRLARKVFERTSAYDRAISQYLGKKESPESSSDLPERIELSCKKSQNLRYGENPHQRAALYVPCGNSSFRFDQLHGKELSYNNFLDIEATIDILREFFGSGPDAGEPAACVVKHTNPCGIAEGEDTAQALEKAIECDGMSAFGGIIGVNRPCDKETAQMAFDKLRFFEVFIAPSFAPQALRILKQRTNLRIIAVGSLNHAGAFDIRVIKSGILLQDQDEPVWNHLAKLKANFKWVTKVKLKESEMGDMIFAWKCVKVVKSNAIVITQGRQTVGIGAGQMSRVDSVQIACQKAGYRTDGGILASDAFFPMPDSIETASEYKIRAIIQPGGSLRDADVIAACDRFGIAMALTGERHFRH